MVERSIIRIKDLSKIYPMGDFEVVALDKVSFEVNKGEFVAIMGPSGSGKSTIMNMIGCLDRPTNGEYYLGDQPVSKLDKVELADIRNKQIGFVFQTFNLLSRTSAIENVTLPLHYDRQLLRTDKEIEDLAAAKLESVGLADRMHHLPHELSGGQRQRVAIARALVNDPLILLADEPTGNLDSKSGMEIMDLLAELHDRGRTIIMVTHEEYIAENASRKIKFFDGHIEQDNKNHKKNKDKENKK